MGFGPFTFTLALALALALALFHRCWQLQLQLSPTIHQHGEVMQDQNEIYDKTWIHYVVPRQIVREPIALQILRRDEVRGASTSNPARRDTARLRMPQLYPPTTPFRKRGVAAGAKVTLVRLIT